MHKYKREKEDSIKSINLIVVIKVLHKDPKKPHGFLTFQVLPSQNTQKEDIMILK